MEYQAWEQTLAMGLGIHKTLQDYFTVRTFRNWLHTILPRAGRTAAQSMLCKHMYCSIVEDHMILITVLNCHLLAHINGMEQLRTLSPVTLI